MSSLKTSSNKSTKKNNANKYLMVKESLKIFLLISTAFSIGLISAYIYFPYPYLFAYLIILSIWFPIMGTILLKQFLLIKWKAWLLDWIKSSPRKLWLVINVSHIIFIFFKVLLVVIVIGDGALILCFLFMRFPASFIIPIITRYAFLVSIFVSICTLTYMHPSQRDALLGCASIKMKKGIWTSLDLYMFSKIKEVLSETSTRRLILASLPLEEIFLMLDAQLRVYSIRSKNLEGLVDDTIEYVLYPPDSPLLFFNKLKILWNDLWVTQKRFSEDGFDVEEYIKMERERKTKALARYKEMQTATKFWVTVITGIGGLIVSIILLYLSIARYLNF